jgi:hypothetical protein
MMIHKIQAANVTWNCIQALSGCLQLLGIPFDYDNLGIR